MGNTPLNCFRIRRSVRCHCANLLVHERRICSSCLFHPVEILLNSTSFLPPEQTYMVRPKGLEFLNSGMIGRKLRIAFHCNSPEQPRLRAISYVGYFFRWCSYGISSPQFATRRTRTPRAGHTLCSFQNWRTTTSCGGCDEQRPAVTFSLCILLEAAVLLLFNSVPN